MAITELEYVVRGAYYCMYLHVYLCVLMCVWLCGVVCMCMMLGCVIVHVQGQRDDELVLLFIINGPLTRLTVPPCCC